MDTILPPVEPDEALVAHGIYRQLRRGKSTRIQEFWTAHALSDGAQIWRSQLFFDGVTPISACFLLRDPDGRPVQMVFYWRWQSGRDDLVEYRFMPDYALVVHGGDVQKMILPANYEVYGWHTITEHFLWAGYDRRLQGRQAVTLVAPGIQHGTLWPALLQVDAELDRKEIVPGPDGPRLGYGFALTMPEIGAQRLHLDAYGVPVRWVLPVESLSVELAEYARIG